MKKTHTFKNYTIDGIEDTYNMKISVKDYILTITEIWEDSKIETKYLLEESMIGLTEKEALDFLSQYFAMTIELEEMGK